jgi:outer membrane protein TolC
MIGRRAGVLVAVTLVAAAGCSVGPDYVRPAAETPGAYKEMTGDGEWKPAQPSDGSVRGPWWEVFGDPTLNSLEAEVSISNQNVLVAEAQFRQARPVLAARRSAFPTATIGAGYTRSRPSATLASSIGPPQGASNDFILPLDVSWDIDVWGRIRRNVEGNRANAQASAGDLEATRLLFQSELAQDYYLLRTLDAQRALLDAAIAAFQTSLQLTRNRYAGGVASAADVAQAETQLKTTQAQATDLGVQRAARPRDRDPDRTDAGRVRDRGRSAPGNPSGYSGRPPVRAPRATARRRRRGATGRRRCQCPDRRRSRRVLPDRDLSATAGFESGSIAKWFMWPSRFFSVGPAVTETVFDGGLRARNGLGPRGIRRDVAGYRETVLGSFQDVEDNLAALRILETEAREQDEAVRAAGACWL